MNRLLLLTIDYPPNRGGVARYLSALAGYFGTRMRVVSNPELLLSRRLRPRWLGAVRLLIRERGTYDTVVTSHVLPIGAAAWLAGFVTCKPYVVIVHGMDIGLVKKSRRKRLLTAAVLRGATLVIANSQSLADEVRGDFAAKRITVAYPPVAVRSDDGWPAKGNPRSRTRAERGPQNGGRAGQDPSSDRTAVLRVLTVARLVPRKGHLRVLEALSGIPDATYEIVGDGPMREEIEEAIRKMGLSGRVTLITDADDAAVTDAYARADLFVMPTVRDDVDREGFGMAYVEAALHGVPSVATDQPGVDEAVLHNETGILVPDGDIEALHGAIARLVSNPVLRSRLGEAAKRRAETLFTQEAQFGKLGALL